MKRRTGRSLATRSARSAVCRGPHRPPPARSRATRARPPGAGDHRRREATARPPRPLGRRRRRRPAHRRRRGRAHGRPLRRQRPEPAPARSQDPVVDGTTHLRLTPVELLARLATLVCRPRTNRVLYTGVWSAHHRWRRAVIALRRDDDEDAATPHQGAEPPASAPPSPNPTWAELMRRGLQVDPLQCPSCGGRVAHVANILDRDTIRRILRHLGLGRTSHNGISVNSSPGAAPGRPSRQRASSGLSSARPDTRCRPSRSRLHAHRCALPGTAAARSVGRPGATGSG